MSAPGARAPLDGKGVGAGDGAGLGAGAAFATTATGAFGVGAGLASKGWAGLAGKGLAAGLGTGGKSASSQPSSMSATSWGAVGSAKVGPRMAPSPAPRKAYGRWCYAGALGA